MFTKHFFKILIIFLVMILLGIIGSFLISHLDKEETQLNSNILPVAK